MFANKAPSTINITYKGTRYTLEFDLESASLLEQQGFNVYEWKKMVRSPARWLPLLFHSAFLMHQKGIERAVTDEILYNLPSTERLFECLTQMYSEVVSPLVSTDKRGKSATWEAN